jgi:group I intron endonuclease
MLIYIIHCLANGKYYVGQTTKSDLQKYLRQKYSSAHHAKKNRDNHLYKALRKYPIESFFIEPLVCNVLTQDDLNNLEQLWIACLDARNPKIGMNTAIGGYSGSTGMKASEDTKKKLRESHLGQPGFWTGKNLSESHREKLRISHLKFVPPSGDVKWCSRCQRFVDKNLSSKTVRGYCRPCQSAYAKERYAKNKAANSDSNLQEPFISN